MDNKVEWDAVFSFDCTLIIGKDGVLQPFEMVIIPKLEINGGASSERLGYVSICLASLANTNKGPIRYLLQDAKSNSLLQISIQMSLVKGDPDTFVNPLPSLKTVSSNAASADNSTQTRKGGQPRSMDPSFDYTPQNRFSIDCLNILEPDSTKDSDLIDSFFAQAKKESDNKN